MTPSEITARVSDLRITYVSVAECANRVCSAVTTLLTILELPHRVALKMTNINHLSRLRTATAM